jgi:hypothetical protein
VPFCSSCGREMPQEALFCEHCGAKATDFTVAHSDFSPSHFNSGMTATSQPLATVPVQDAGPALPPPSPDEGKRKGGRRGVVVVVIVALAVLLVGVTLETVFLGSGAGTSAVNSPSNPMTGKQLYAAYATNQTSAVAAYTNKTLYIQDTLDSGVGLFLGTGYYYSSVDSGTVVLIWNTTTPVDQLNPGALVLARCSVEGLQVSNGAGTTLYLQACDLISVQPQTTTTSAQSVTTANL